MDKLLHENMIWHDTNEINKYTENTIENRKKPAKTAAKIILAATQYNKVQSKTMHPRHISITNTKIPIFCI